MLNPNHLNTGRKLKKQNVRKAFKISSERLINIQFTSVVQKTKPIFYLERMSDHLKLALFVIQCCIGIWDLWQPQDILLHRTHKSVRSLHQDHHMELLQQNKTYFIH